MYCIFALQFLIMKNLYKEFQPIGKSWLMELNNYNEVPFKRKTSKIKWSLGEIYSHLCDSTLQFHLRGVERCLTEPKAGKKSWSGKMVFLKGNFDNKKLKSFMEKEHGPKEAEEITIARDKMIRVLKNMDECWAHISSDNPNQKAEHPVLGYLTASEWYRLAIFHFEYHRKNKVKIDDFLTS